MRSIWFHGDVHAPVDPAEAEPVSRTIRILVANGMWAVPVEERPSGWQKLKLPEGIVETQIREDAPDERPAMTGTAHYRLMRRTA